ncbi:MAG: hypothetical protein AAF869_12000 [Pseudomonadota bacterium]
MFRVGFLALSVMGIALTGCSVGMAARTEGVKADEISQCETRACFLSADTAQMVSAKDRADGGKVETYRFQLKRGSAGRAAMHGVLDVATIGLWEVVGTPMEATKSKKYIMISALYDEAGDLQAKVFGDGAAFETEAFTAQPAVAQPISD